MRHMKPLRFFQDVHKQKVGHLLGLDVGDKYVGLALSDSSKEVASPLSYLVRDRNSVDSIATYLQNTVSQFSLVGFVVGYPVDWSRNIGSVENQAVKVKRFIKELSDSGKLEGVCYTFWEESFTTMNVNLLLLRLELDDRVHKNISDAYAAMGILQGYLDFASKKQRSEYFN